MPTEREALRLVKAIHGAALDPAAWQGVAVEINRVMGCGGISIHAIDEAARISFPIGVDGFDPGYIDSYISHYGAISPWPEIFMSMPRARARHSFSDIPLDDYVKTEFYQGWMRPQEERIASVGVRTAGSGPRSVLTTMNLRNRDRERREAPALRLLNWLHLDLSHAAEVNNALARLSAQSIARLAQAGDGPDGGIAIISDDQVLLWADTGAVGLLGTQLRTSPTGRVTLLDPGAQNWFETVLATLRHRGEVGPHGTFRIAGALADDIWTIRAARCDSSCPPVQHVSSETPTEKRALALIFEREATRQTPRDQLRRQFGLTVAEVEVAFLLAEGYGTDEIAQQRQSSRNTIRNQIQALLWKMDARTRGDVIRIVLRLIEPRPKH